MATSTKKFSSYGLRELSIAGLTTDEAPKAEYGDISRVWAAQSSSVSLTFTENSLRGDDGTVENDTNIDVAEFSFENGIITFEALKILTGGAVEDLLEGADPGTKIGETFSLDGGQSLPYFGLIGRTEKNGTFKFILTKAKINSLEFTFTDQEYCILSVGGVGVQLQADSKLMFLKKYNKSNPITVEDFNYTEEAVDPAS